LKLQWLWYYVKYLHLRLMPLFTLNRLAVTVTVTTVTLPYSTAFTRNFWSLKSRNNRRPFVAVEPGVIAQDHRSKVSQYKQIMSHNNSQRRSNSGGGGQERGEYYRNKYGGGGRGRGGRHQTQQEQNQVRTVGRGGGSYQNLKSLLQRIDGRSYPAYHDLETSSSGTGWINQDVGFTLQIGRAQSDPFAPPTRCRLTIPHQTTQLPVALFQNNKIRCMALGDYLWRQLYRNCKTMGADHSLRTSTEGGGGWKGPKGGDIQVMEPTQHVMEQTAVWIDEKSGNVTCQITINLPARGRTILGHAAAQILDPVLSQLVHDSFKALSLNLDDMQRHVESIEDQVWLQSQLDGAGLVAFVPNGAILPRVSGVDDRPMQDSNENGVVAFQSPANLETSFTLPNAGTTIAGMGIPKGITLICGGGFHGKSTLLECLQLAVYCKVPRDGREFCVTTRSAAKIRAEDGRSIHAVDISSFINNLPFGQDTTCFSTMDASGSTSQASNIVEVRQRKRDGCCAFYSGLFLLLCTQGDCIYADSACTMVASSVRLTAERDVFRSHVTRVLL